MKEESQRPAAALEAQWLLYLGFAYLLLDSLLSYIIANWFGLPGVPTTALAPVLLFFGLYLLGVERILPGPARLLVLAVMLNALIFGAFYNFDELWEPLARYVGAAATFIFGYACLVNCARETAFFRILWVVAGAYTFVSFAAVVGLAPELFPVFGREEYIGDIRTIRLEVTTDPNFQVMYAVSAAALLIVARTPIQLAILALMQVLNLFVLSELQTRSGFILYAAGLGLAVILAVRRLDSSQRIKALLPGSLLVIGLLYFSLDALIPLFETIRLRFTLESMATFDARLTAVTFFFKSVVDPSMWVPLDANVFFELHQSAPHFAPAILLLNGGIVAVIGWLLLQAIPVMKGLLHVVRSSHHSNILGVVAVISSVVFLASLTLPIDSTDQIWLWAGAVTGCLKRESKNWQEVQLVDCVDLESSSRTA